MLKEVIFLLIFYHFFNCYMAVDENDYNVWGPGLNPEIVMPARYFFIERKKTSPLNKSPDLNVNIQGNKISQTNYPCRIWTNVLDRKDNSFIIRYKLYEPCFNLKISVTDNGKEVTGFPKGFKGVTYHENCDCILRNSSDFINTWECGNTQNRIKDDLLHFQAINFNELRTKIITTYNNPGAISLCNYVVKDNLIYRKCYGQHVGFKMFMDSILLSLTRKIKMPDIEFFVNLGDWPLVQKDLIFQKNLIFPIFSWCGSSDSYDIVMPTYDITESTLENMGRVTLDILSVQGNVKEKWENRISKAFWRGRDSSRERLKLIEISREHPDLFNVSLTNFFFFRNEMEKYGPTSKHVSFFEFFDYKYQINVDGTVASYRFPYLLAGGAPVFKQDSKYYEFFYDKIKPNYHYIPVKRDLSDLVEKLEWAIENDEEVRRIGQNGRDFANSNLLPKDIFCYYVQLFTEYSNRIVSKIEILEDMELVQPSTTENCDCKHNIKDEL